MSDDAYDLGAEQALLGSVLLAPETAGPALLGLPADVWWHPRHATLAAVLTERLRAGEPVDPQVVLAALIGRRGFDGNPGVHLHTLMQSAWTPTLADNYAHRIARCAARRNLSASLLYTRQQLNESWLNGGGDESIARVTAELRARLDTADRLDAGVELDQPSPSLDDLLAGTDEYDWLVPGLFERGERLLLTGGEGGGKSWLIRQLAACMAAGVHPFTGAILGRGDQGVRVLIVDCENNARQSRRAFRRIAERVDEVLRGAQVHPAAWRERVRFETRPEGLDLLGDDAAWLERKVAANSPDLLVCGPLYRLTSRSVADEDTARQLIATLDGIRVRYGCALVTEAHAGHEKDPITGDRKLRPAGSSLFLRWPEFGFGMARAKGDPGEEHPKLVDVVAWRGSREERQWPAQLQHSLYLPWMPADESYYEEAA
ncbi:AAA family ATPase [Pseudonocardia sp. NPDC049635]|uniref:AAA family ATPase n=1 Tax=Pseudonocardia sp. NPDC049635 TaxID=3155506 RepID=UPI0033F32590